MESVRGMNMVLLGPPGAGKSTQGQRLAALLGIPHISSGALFRALQTQDTPLALEVRVLMGRGAYVPNALTTQVVLERLRQPDAQRGFILDGYPRTVRQAEDLDAALGAEGRQVDVALDITAPPAVIRQRLAGRLAAEGRSDDTPEVVEQRLETYRLEALPVAGYYRAQGKLVTVDGARPLPDVDAAVDEVLGLKAR